MINKATISLLVVFAAVSIYIGFWANDMAYFLGDQFNECVLLLIIAINTRELARTLSITLLILATFELIDEIAGRNTNVYFNDYVPIALAAIYLIWKFLKKK